ncbi:MAG: ABC transporter substrate-binding protein [Betaproteobacteria bacterium]|nr:ABC transporter substrate-binding protein [Betaproteobacteria bacterium]MBK8689569.1 ABC transporter substrate-binding protein [Betaproteobacteria bacterium]MBL0289137.1 ABC transporter substrate-binding protein [Betaproteobacteria bacterium]
MRVCKWLPLLAAAVALAAGAARADINVGVTLSATGPAASLGIPEKNTFELMPTTIGGQKVNWIVLDDATDTTKAVTNTRKLLTENKVDVIVGSTITPNSLAMVDVVADAETPMISMAASARIVDPANPKTRWVFKTPQNDALMADAIAVHMKANGVKTMGYIGFADAYGDGWLAEMRRSAQTAGIKIVVEEKYQRNDASVTGQVLKIVAANPDAVLIGAAGTPGATPQKELASRNYKGRIYQTHGVANPDFLRVVGKDGNGTILPIGPMLVYEQLPDSNPLKKTAAEYITKYEAKHGKDSRSTFGGHAWDAYLLLARAIPEALKKAKPGTKEFRAALRDALENTKELVATHGVYTMTPQDHNGLDNRARTMIRIDNGKWVPAK